MILPIASPHSAYDRDTDSIVADATHPKAALLSVCFEPTNRCRGGCPYCLIEHHQRDQPTERLARSLSLLLDYGVMRVGFGGGEPLDREDIFELGMSVRERAAGSLLRTSGMHAIPVDMSLRAFDWVDISFDSIDSARFTACRPGVPFDSVKGNLIALAEAGARVRVSILLTQASEPTVDATMTWLASIGIINVRLQTLVRRGRARRNWDKLSLTAAEGQHATARATVAADKAGVHASELHSVAATTLCIIKPDGLVAIGEPAGSRIIGHIDDPATLNNAVARVGHAQVTNYLSYA